MQERQSKTLSRFFCPCQPLQLAVVFDPRPRAILPRAAQLADFDPAVRRVGQGTVRFTLQPCRKNLLRIRM